MRVSKCDLAEIWVHATCTFQPVRSGSANFRPHPRLQAPLGRHHGRDRAPWTNQFFETQKELHKASSQILQDVEQARKDGMRPSSPNVGHRRPVHRVANQSFCSKYRPVMYVLLYPEPRSLRVERRICLRHIEQMLIDHG